MGLLATVATTPAGITTPCGAAAALAITVAAPAATRTIPAQSMATR